MEKEIVAYFAKNIREFMPSLDISLIKTDANIDGKRADILVKTKDNEQIIIEVKSFGEPSSLFKAISQLKYYKTDEIDYLMVAVPKMTEQGKAICRNLGVGYMDLQGNVFAKFRDKLIDREASNRQISNQFVKEKKRVKKIFSRDSLRLFIVMLNNTGRWLTQKELSMEASISKGYINRILKTLESGVKVNSDVLLVDGPKTKERLSNIPGNIAIAEARWRATSKKKTSEYRITNPSKLLDILSNQYDFSKNKVISLYSFEKDSYKLMRDIATQSKKFKLDYALTMHAGASQIAPFVRFEDVYFYTKNEEMSKWINALDLKQTEFGGNVFLVVPQDEWILNQTQTANDLKTVSDVQLYLDLINYPKRGKEQAEFLRKEKMGF